MNMEDRVRQLEEEVLCLKQLLLAQEEKGGPGGKLPPYVLPWCNVIKAESCKGIRVNHGLYTQCKNKAEDLCKSCSKGTICRVEDREKFKDEIHGKKIEKYGDVMKKLKISKEQAYEWARLEEIELKEEDLMVSEKKRGRKKKEVDETEEKKKRGRPKKEIEDEQVEKKKRGRPKKEKTVIESSIGDEVLKNLVSSATEEEVDEEGTLVEKFEFEGKTYLKDSENMVYDMESQDEIGIYDPNENKINRL